MIGLRIAAAECYYQLRALQFWASFVALLGFGFLLTANAGEFQAFAAGGMVYANAPYAITDTLLRLTIAGVIMVPAFIGSALLKDIDSHYDAIIFSAPISKGAYLHGRFAGSLAAMALAFSGAPLGLALGTAWPWADASLLGPFRPLDYLSVFLMMVLPSLFVISAIGFAVVTATRSMMYSYVAVLVLLLCYFVGTVSEWISPLLDPFAYEVFVDATRYWTASERNTQLLPMGSDLLINRALWLAVAVIAYGMAFRRFSFRTAPTAARARSVDVETPGRQAPPQRQSPVQWGWATTSRQLFARTTFELSLVMRSAPFLIILALTILLLGVSLTEREVSYGVNAYPLTRLLVGSFTMLTLPMMVLAAFYSAEIFWRERETGYQGILAAAPVSNAVFVGGKVLALCLLLLSMVTVAVLVAVAFQLAAGEYPVDGWLFISRAYVTVALPMLYIAVLTCSFQAVAPGRYVGMLLFGLFFAGIIASRDLLGWEHPLASYALPVLPAPLSDFNAPGELAALGHWARVYWGALAVMLLSLTFVLWNRAGGPLGWTSALRRIARPVPLAVLGAAILVAVSSGGFIYYNTNVLNDYVTGAEKEVYQVEYEQRFARYASLPMPKTVDLVFAVDLFPTERRVLTRATHVLENRTAETIHEIHLVFPSALAVGTLSIEGMEQARREPGPFNYFIVDLAQPMSPGDTRTMNSASELRRTGFEHYQQNTTLVANGTFLMDMEFLPHVGFQPDYLLKDARTREFHGLDPIARRPPLEATDQHQHSVGRQDSDFLNYSAVVSTVVGQTALAPGKLLEQWIENDRAYFRYGIDVPVRQFFSVLSADYAVVRDRWNDVEIEIFHHPGHDRNLHRMVQATKDSLAYFSEAFSPYPYKTLRIVEFPAYRSFAQAFPGMIPFSESMGFVADVQPDDIDMPYYVTAHEIAHQWWGHQVSAANVQGDGLIHESLAQYSALLIMENKQGSHRMRRFLAYELDRYLSQRADDPVGEKPLYREENQSYLHYRKGSLVMYALRDYLGTETVNKALHKLVALRGFSGSPHTTSLDLLAMLKEDTSQADVELIVDLLEKITLYDTGVVSAATSLEPDGRHRVSLSVSARKFYAEPDGTETEALFDLPVDIGVFRRHPSDPDFTDSDVLYLAKHAVAGKATDIEIIIDSAPVFVGVDPYAKLIGRDPDDNVQRVAADSVAFDGQ